MPAPAPTPAPALVVRLPAPVVRLPTAWLGSNDSMAMN